MCDCGCVRGGCEVYYKLEKKARAAMKILNGAISVLLFIYFLLYVCVCVCVLHLNTIIKTNYTDI